MPPLYGEGERAFRRLQEEIVQRVPDQSLFAWEDLYRDIDENQDLAQCSSLRAAITWGCVEVKHHRESLFASSPDEFSFAGRVRAVPRDDVLHKFPLPHIPPIHYTSTPYGIQTQVPVIPLAIFLYGPRNTLYILPTTIALTITLHSEVVCLALGHFLRPMSIDPIEAFRLNKFVDFSGCYGC